MLSPANWEFTGALILGRAPREPLAAAPYERLLSVAADSPGSRMPLGQGPAGVALPIHRLRDVTEAPGA